MRQHPHGSIAVFHFQEKVKVSASECVREVDFDGSLRVRVAESNGGKRGVELYLQYVSGTDVNAFSIDDLLSAETDHSAPVLKREVFNGIASSVINHVSVLKSFRNNTYCPSTVSDCFKFNFVHPAAGKRRLRTYLLVDVVELFCYGHILDIEESPLFPIERQAKVLSMRMVTDC